jgi:hypothetical protein
MCFYHDDYDWIARVFEETTAKADKPLKCLECFRHVGPGEAYTHIEMREYEECRVCQEDRDDGRFREDFDCEAAGGKHDFGEEDTHRICDRCQKLLEAIQRVEEDDGCSGQETRPALAQLRDAFWESDHAQAYLDRARADSPELAMSGHLDHFYELTAEWRDRFEENDWRGDGEPAWFDDDVGPTDELGGEG